ncbi:MAG: YggS family pyridoxal phosphate-dependent enzyme [Ruminococcus sp.]|nr:YggS family pyridoxal phosphate-dependent enzyme [Ruminococcus sp.]MBP3797733.1 YggS family pyridoxal phosphate-dependent enzyme [Ruminococcus sp.]MBQ1432785.1 YggS family pyridoxal phosphate-dependent enzyme [Ruminococcus sp.]
MCQLTAQEHQKDPQNEFSDVLENYKRICYNVENAKAKYRSSDENIQIMAVTKTVAPEKINFAISQGITLLGENRVQEYLSKKDQYDKTAQVHMIGRLQTNKVKYIINEVSMIQSVDSIKLAKEINRLAVKNDRTMDVLIEINIGDEASKSGIAASGLDELIDEVAQLENVRIKGLMAIPPIGCGEDVFDKMHSIFLRVKERSVPGVSMDILSMGMSGDYELAIKHGSGLVRIGTALFGARNYLEG